MTGANHTPPPCILCALRVLCVKAFEFLRRSHSVKPFNTKNTENTEDTEIEKTLEQNNLRPKQLRLGTRVNGIFRASCVDPLHTPRDNRFSDSPRPDHAFPPHDHPSNEQGRRHQSYDSPNRLDPDARESPEMRLREPI